MKRYAVSATAYFIRQVEMCEFSAKRVEDALLASDSARSSTERGQALETLIAYILECCPGVRHFKSNGLNASGSSEIDVCFWNNRHPESLDFLPQILVVECKNSIDRVASGAVRIFRDKLQDMHLDFGILIAANGVTGDKDNLRAAHDVIRTAFHINHIRIVVLTRDELLRLHRVDDIVLLLQDKILLLTMHARTFET